MAKLTTEERNKLPDSDFALPGREYPIHDEAHARDALARASEEHAKGNLSSEQLATIRRKVSERHPGIQVSEPKKMSLSVERDGRGNAFMSLRGGATEDAQPSDLFDESGNALPTSILGFPCTYAWKDLSSEGNWHNPAKNFDFPVNAARIGHWVKTFQSMSQNGVRVPIVDDHNESAKNGNGKIVKLRKKGDTLQGLMQLVGEESARKLACNDVSVGVADELKDGDHHTYQDAIQHVAIVTRPCNPGLEQPVLAASLAAADTASKTSAADSRKEMNMAEHNLPVDNATMSKLEKHVGGLAKKPLEEKAAHVADHCEAMGLAAKKMCNMSDDGDAMMAMSLISDKLKSVPTSISAPSAVKVRRALSLAVDIKDAELPELIADKVMSLTAEVSTKDSRIATLTEQNQALNAQIHEMSQSMPQDPPPALQQQWYAAWKQLTDNYVGLGHCTTPEVKTFEALYGISDGKVKGMALSGVPHRPDAKLMFENFKWAMSLSGNAVRTQAGTQRDPNLRAVDMGTMADATLTREGWRSVGINNPPKEWVKEPARA